MICLDSASKKLKRFIMTITIYSRTDRIYLKKKVSYRNRQNERPKKKNGRKIFVETRNENKLKKVNSKLMDMIAKKLSEQSNGISIIREKKIIITFYIKSNFTELS